MTIDYPALRFCWSYASLIWRELVQTWAALSLVRQHSKWEWSKHGYTGFEEQTRKRSPRLDEVGGRQRLP